jgi:glutamyl-tRNA synthetase
MKDVMSSGDFEAGEAIKIVDNMVEKVNSMSKGEQEEELSQYDPSYFNEDVELDDDILPELPNIGGEDVRLRAAPNPNSFWHLGHARMPSVLGTYTERDDGDMVVRFDDTDPANKRPNLDAYEKILEDIRYLGFEPDEVYYASDRMDKYYKYARKLLENGTAYICSCDTDKMQDDRREGVRCQCYKTTNHIEKFDQMVSGEYNPRDYVVKIATDMEHKNPAVRDWVAFRILSESHPRDLGTTYDLWPTLDFQSAIDDYLLDISHIIRGIGLQDSEKRQNYIYKSLGWEYPETLHWGRIDVDEYDIPLSSSTINEKIESGELSSWDSILSPTLESLKRRGIRGQAIVDSMLELGLSTNDATLSMSQIYQNNREIIDDTVDRAFIALDNRFDRFEVYDGPDVANPPLNPSSNKKRTLSVGNKILLPDDAKVPTGERVWLKGLGCYLLGRNALWFDTDDTSIVEDGHVPVAYWVPEDTSVRIYIEMPDGTVEKGWADSTLSDASEGETFRFGLFGFVTVYENGDIIKTAYCHE